MPPNFFICFFASSWPGCDGQARVQHASTSGRCSSHSATAWALSLCRSIRTPRVLRPRVVRNASIGPETAPTANCTKPIFSASSASLTTMAPPTTSEWPPMYLVVECTTTSAPRASGCLQVGRREGVIDDQEGPGVVRHLGERLDVGDLHHRVGRRLHPDEAGLVAPATAALQRAARSDMSTGVLPIPHVAQHAADQPVGAAVGVVAEHDVVAGPQQGADQGILGGEARAEGVARAYRLRGRRAVPAGRPGWGCRRGRTRSRPGARRCRPAHRWRLKCSGGTTAPVRGSKAWPACTARVLKPWFSD